MKTIFGLLLIFSSQLALATAGYTADENGQRVNVTQVEGTYCMGGSVYFRVSIPEIDAVPSHATYVLSFKDDGTPKKCGDEYIPLEFLR